MTQIHLQPIFMNIDMMISLLNVSALEAKRLRHYSQPGSGYEVSVYDDLARKLEDGLSLIGATELQIGLMKGSVGPGSLVGVEHDFYFKRQAGPPPLIRAWRKSNTEEQQIIEALIDPERLVFSSAHGILSGQNSVYMLGLVTLVSPELVRLRPIFIGWRAYGLSDDDLRIGIVDSRQYVHPSQIDQFASVNWARELTTLDMRAMAAMPEADVKAAIAEALGDVDPQKDWGGERSDHYSTQVTVNRKPMRSAWLLKGKSVQREMNITHLGKNGDQIDRLFTEPADLHILQSNQKVSSALRHMLDVYARDPHNPTQYSILDGAETARLLLSRGRLHPS